MLAAMDAERSLSKTLMHSIRGIDPSTVISRLFLALDYKYPREDCSTVRTTSA
jgi:hypothetical protein